MIIALCIGGYECSTAPQAYYLANPGLQTWAKQRTRKYQEMISQTPLEKSLPTLLGAGFVLAGGRARLRISRHVSVQIGQDRTIANFTYVF